MKSCEIGVLYNIEERYLHFLRFSLGRDNGTRRATISTFTTAGMINSIPEETVEGVQSIELKEPRGTRGSVQVPFSFKVQGRAWGTDES